MTRVRARRRHENAIGTPYVKHPGRVYDHPSPEQLITSGILEKADDTVSARRRTRARAGPKPAASGGTSGGDGEGTSRGS